jgi:hypothetical protein
MRWNNAADQKQCLAAARRYLRHLRTHGKMPTTRTDSTPASIAAVAESLATAVLEGRRPESWLDAWHDEA